MVTCGACGIVYADPAPPSQQLTHVHGQPPELDEALEEDKYASYAPLLDRACQLTLGRGCFLEIGGTRGAHAALWR